MSPRTWLKRRGVSMLLASLVMLAAASASAHITNEKTTFPDIASDPHAPDIVALVALRIIPETFSYFRPDQPLTRQQLAAWAALARRIDQGGEAPDVRKLIKDGSRLLRSTQGNATAADIDQAIFDGSLKLSEPERTFSRSDAAAFIFEHLTPSYLAKLGVTPGPTGRVTAIKTKNFSNGHIEYTFTIGDATHLVYAHCNVVGPTDLGTWKGAQVVRSYVMKFGKYTLLIFLQEAGTS